MRHNAAAVAAFVCALGLSLLTLAAPLGAQETAESPAAEPAEAGPAVSAPVAAEKPALPGADVFLDGLITAEMAARHIPGACLAVVKDGRIVLLAGYGSADIERGVPVDPKATLFRPGSVSKLFVWTAIMQLVEEGRIDLGADVNTYLKDLKIPEAFGRPVTVADLLTHTPGFEDDPIGVVARGEADLLPLDTVLRDTMPARVFPPGTVPAYSNYGAALAGKIVADVTGKPFEAAIEERILTPLGMRRSTFRQPLPEGLAGLMAKGYAFSDGRQQEKKFELIQVAPAGSLSATAEDMAAFMIAHLSNGGFGAARILKPETAALMHARHFGADPRLSGMAYGFYEWLTDGRRLILHEGDSEVFHTILALYPDQNLGVYLSFNGAMGALPRREIVKALLDRYYPGTPPAKPAPGGKPDKLAEAAPGWYEPSRVPFTTVEAVLRLASQAKMTVEADGGLKMAGILGAMPRVFAPAGSGLFRQASAVPDALALAVDKDGRVTGYALDSMPFETFFRVESWYLTFPAQVALILVCLAVFLSGCLGWPVAYLARRGESPRRPYVPAGPGWLAIGTGAAFLAFLVGYGVLASDGSFAYGLSMAAKIVLGLPYLVLALAVAGLCLAVWSWVELVLRRPSPWSLGGRLHYALVLAAFAGWLTFLHHWQLLRLPG